MTMEEARALADLVAGRLFINGQGQESIRLVIELPGGGNGGGWSRAAVIGQVADVLMEEKR